jgi:hypothetical protein
LRQVIGEVKLNNTARVRVDSYYENRENSGYAANPISQAQIYEGYFYKENFIKEMAIRKVNTSLCAMLAFFIVAAFVSYYFAMSNEITLNTLSRQVTTLNDENMELQNNLDRLKSFNNVDSMMAQQNILQKPAKVIEVTQVAAAVAVNDKKSFSNNIDWSIGY